MKEWLSEYWYIIVTSVATSLVIAAQALTWGWILIPCLVLLVYFLGASWGRRWEEQWQEATRADLYDLTQKLLQLKIKEGQNWEVDDEGRSG